MANLGCSKDSNTDSAWSPCKKPSSRKPAGFFKLRIVFRSGTPLGEVGVAAAHSEPHIRHLCSLDACSFSDAHGFNGCRSSRPRVVSVLAVASGRDASPSRLANTCGRGGPLVLSRIVGRARDITQRLRTDRTNGVLKGCRCWLAQTATTGRGASLARFENICDRGRTFGASPDVVY